MTRKIELLSDQTINQIAAGEVIENPASVVKELVENSVDAGARQITIEVKGGGLGLIRISDDGEGMHREDALLSLQRHATSKLKEVDDLSTLLSMGFRGEALPSIASISRLTLTTAPADNSGTRIETEGGKILSVSPAARNRGTTIEVAALFSNVPARKRFQKSPSALSAEITKMVTLLSLAYPELSFELIQNEKRTLFTEPDRSLVERAKELLGEEFGESSFFIDHAEEGLSLSGVLGKPLYSRPNRTGQYLFINRRPVLSLPLSYAVKEGYGTRLEELRHPLFVLHLSLPPALVDVNVHPQKREVRFKEEAALKEQIRKAVALSMSRCEEHAISSLPAFSFPSAQESSFRSDCFFSSTPTFSFKEEPSLPTSSAPLHFKEDQELSEQPLFSFQEERISSLSLFRHYLLIDAQRLFNTIPTKGGLLLVDLLAASASLLFHLLATKEENCSSQILLFPLPLALSATEIATALASAASLRKLGFEMHPSGPHSLLIDAIPSDVDESEVKNLLLGLLEDLKLYDKQKERALALSCMRLAKMRKKAFTQEEGEKITQELLLLQDPLYSPVGTKTIIEVTEHELAQRFSL